MFSYKAKNYALLKDDGTMSITGAALKSRGMEPFLRSYLEGFLRLLLEGEAKKAGGLRDVLTDRIRRRELPITELAKTEALQDSLASYQKKIGASSRNRSAAFELAIKSGRPYQAGDQVSYYVTGTRKKSSPTKTPASSPNGTSPPRTKTWNTTSQSLKSSPKNSPSTARSRLRRRIYSRR